MLMNMVDNNMVMDGFVPTLVEGLMLLFSVIIGLVLGIGLAWYFGEKDEALLDYAEPFEESECDGKENRDRDGGT
jgi:hypothetical protein